MKKIVFPLIIAAVIIGGSIAGFFTSQPVKLGNNLNTDTVFQNVITDITNMTVTPHAAGSEANHKVSDYIVSRIQSIGLQVELLPFEMNVDELLQKQMDYYNSSSQAYKNRIANYMKQDGVETPEQLYMRNIGGKAGEILKCNNVLTKVESSKSDNAIMIVAHYDSVVKAPGAADDGLAVATMLNLIESLKNDEYLQNDVYFLFTDAEEQGLIGANHFVTSSPDYKDKIDLLFNLEARGNDGALIMFESSANNYDMVRHMAASSVKPVSFSLATAVYDQMPNGTDFTEFKDVGYKGLNFAILEGSDAYHQPSDNVENLNRDAAYNYYINVFFMGEYFAKINLDTIQHNTDAVFFPLPAIGLVVIPGIPARILGFLPLLLAIALIFLYRKTSPEESGLQLKRTIPLAVLGLLPAVITLFYFPASYLFSIPVLSFMILEFMMVFAHKTPAWLRKSMLAFCLLVCCLIYAPIVYLIHIALASVPVTIIFAALPVSISLVYIIRVFKSPNTKKTMPQNDVYKAEA